MPPQSQKRSKISVIRFIYLYLITAITFIIFIIGAVSIVDQGLKSFVFDVVEYDYYDRPIPVMMDCEMYLNIENPEAYEKCLDKQREILPEKEEKKSTFTNESKRRLSIGIAQVLVAFPLWIFHWSIIERDRKRKLTK